MSTYDPALNSRRCYDLSINALREINIRKHQIKPRPDHPDECRWATEGEVPIPQLETVKREGRR